MSAHDGSTRSALAGGQYNGSCLAVGRRCTTRQRLSPHTNSGHRSCPATARSAGRAAASARRARRGAQKEVQRQELAIEKSVDLLFSLRSRLGGRPAPRPRGGGRSRTSRPARPCGGRRRRRTPRARRRRRWRQRPALAAGTSENGTSLDVIFTAGKTPCQRKRPAAWPAHRCGSP